MRILKWTAGIVVLLLVGLSVLRMWGDARVVEEVADNPDGERAGIVTLLTFASGRQIPVNYLREGNQVFIGADGPWWREFTDGGQPVNLLVKGEHLDGHATTVLDDPAYTRDVFNRLRPTAPEWLPDWLNGKLIVVELITTGSNPLNQLTDAERDAGWQLLFDGQSLSGWRNYRSATTDSRWIVQDSAITLVAGGGGDLISRQQFGNYELALEWNIAPGGNSGIFIQADETGERIYYNAPEIQILDNERHPDNKLDTHLAGSLYDMIAAPAQAHQPAGTWNSTRVKMHNRTLSIWLNEALVTEIDMQGEAWHQAVANSKFQDWEGFGKNAVGHIGFQDHGDRVQFRNIRLRELGP